MVKARNVDKALSWAIPQKNILSFAHVKIAFTAFSTKK